MATALADLPAFLVLEPRGGVRLKLRLEAPACELELRLENERPGRSFIAMIGQRDGSYVQRVRLAGRAKLYFDPESPGDYPLLLTNPTYEPIVIRIKGRNVVPRAARRARPRKRPSRPAGPARRRR